ENEDEEEAGRQLLREQQHEEKEIVAGERIIAPQVAPDNAAHRSQDGGNALPACNLPFTRDRGYAPSHSRSSVRGGSTRSKYRSSNGCPTSEISEFHTIRPFRSMRIWPARRSMMESICEVRKTVIPRPAMTASRSRMVFDVTGSTPSNGSSKNRTRGLCSSASASDVFLRIPCEHSLRKVWRPCSRSSNRRS